MNKKLRLIVTRKCPRQCPGCCNNGYTDVGKIDLWEIFQYDEVYITGGEPMMDHCQDRVEELATDLKKYKPNIFICLYTADSSGTYTADVVEWGFDAMTFTLHTDADAEAFIDMNDYMLCWKDTWSKKSLRLNWFKDCKLPEDIDLSLWDVVRDKEWVEDCPIPEGEDLRELTTLW